MKEQNFENHSRLLMIYHIVGPGVLLAILIGSVVNLVNSAKENLYSASLILVLTLIIILLWYYVRAFAIKAQDRAIRAEENFRHYLLTGKPLDKNLRLSQIIALRFASDEEFPDLAAKTLTEGLSAKKIKSAIRQWRADHHRA
jgi:hypothetical protein